MGPVGPHINHFLVPRKILISKLTMNPLKFKKSGILTILKCSLTLIYQSNNIVSYSIKRSMMQLGGTRKLKLSRKWAYGGDLSRAENERRKQYLSSLRVGGRGKQQQRNPITTSIFGQRGWSMAGEKKIFVKRATIQYSGSEATFTIYNVTVIWRNILAHWHS